MSKIQRALQEEARRAHTLAEPSQNPQRYSCRSGDDGYDNWMEGRRTRGNPRIYLNGALITCAFVADEVQGVIVAAEQPLRLKNDEIVTIELRGCVRVVWGDE